MRLENKIALVTGASGGLGAGICQAFAGEGADVVVAYHSNRDTAEQTAAEVEQLGRKALIVKADTSSESDVKAMVQKSVETFGHLDIVVANAGLGMFKHLMETTVEDFEKLVRVNLIGTYLTVRHGAEPMLARKSGKIITMSSVHGIGATHWGSLYEATKAGIANFTRGAAFDLANYNIQVNSIAPGAVPVPNDSPPEKGSPLYEAWIQYTPLGRFGKPEDIAAGAVYLASRDSDWVTGQVLSIDGGITAGPLIPSFEHYGPNPKM